MWLAISALLAYGAAALALEARRARGLTVARLTLAAVAAGALAIVYLISAGGYTVGDRSRARRSGRRF